jgi:hypothetical protein
MNKAAMVSLVIGHRSLHRRLSRRDLATEAHICESRCVFLALFCFQLFIVSAGLQVYPSSCK